jgi:hypothetical protein
MLEAASCSGVRLADTPAVDCTALQGLKTLLHGGVLQDRAPARNARSVPDLRASRNPTQFTRRVIMLLWFALSGPPFVRSS